MHLLPASLQKFTGLCLSGWSVALLSFFYWVRPGETSLSVQFARQMSVLCPFWQSNLKSKRTNHQESWNNMKQLLRQFDIRLFMTYPLTPLGFTTTLPTSMAPWLVFQLQGLAIGWVDTTGRNWSLLDSQVRQRPRPSSALNPMVEIWGFSLIIHEDRTLVGRFRYIYIYCDIPFMTIVIIYIHISNGIVYRTNWKCEVELAQRGTTLYCNKHAKNRCTIKCKDLELAKIP